MDKYTLDKCLICGKHTGLCNGVCAECAHKTDLPDCFKNIFGGFENDKKS
jgi:hypothetical protein